MYVTLKLIPISLLNSLNNILSYINISENIWMYCINITIQSISYLLNFCLISLLLFSSKLSSLPLIHSSFIIPNVLLTTIISLQMIEHLFLSNSRISFPYLIDKKYLPVESNHHQKLTCLPVSFLIVESPLSKQIMLYCNCLFICLRNVILLLTTLSCRLGFLLGVKFNDLITFVVMSFSKVNYLHVNLNTPVSYNYNQQLNISHRIIWKSATSKSQLYCKISMKVSHRISNRFFLTCNTR